MGRLTRVFGRVGDGNAWQTVEDPTLEVVAGEVVHEGGGVAPAFVFVQPVPASVWTIPHGLDHVPQLTVVRDDGERIVLYRCSVPDDNTVVLEFSPAMAGQAVLV